VGSAPRYLGIRESRKHLVSAAVRCWSFRRIAAVPRRYLAASVATLSVVDAIKKKVGTRRYANSTTHLYPELRPPGHFPVETHDLVIVGGGFSGHRALTSSHKHQESETRPACSWRNPPLGGEAKQNDFEVDGIHLTGPQGSNRGSDTGPRSTRRRRALSCLR